MISMRKAKSQDITSIHASHIFGLSCWSTRSSGGNAALSRSDDGASYYYNEATDLAMGCGAWCNMGCCAFLVHNYWLGERRHTVYYVHMYIYIYICLSLDSCHKTTLLIMIYHKGY